MSEFKKVYNFKTCGWDTPREFALDILPHMRKDILAGLEIIRWTDEYLPVVHTTYQRLSGMADWACDNFRYSFDILWNGK